MAYSNCSFQADYIVSTWICLLHIISFVKIDATFFGVTVTNINAIGYSVKVTHRSNRHVVPNYGYRLRWLCCVCVECVFLLSVEWKFKTYFIRATRFASKSILFCLKMFDVWLFVTYDQQKKNRKGWREKNTMVIKKRDRKRERNEQKKRCFYYWYDLWITTIS